MTPQTLRMRSDEITRDLHTNPKLMASVLDGLIEKRAADVIPAEVQKIATEIRNDTGVSEEASLKMAWQTYTTYVNPGYRREKAAEVTKVTAEKLVKEAAPRPAPEPSPEAAELAEKLGKGYGKHPKKKDNPAPPKKGAYKSAQANELIEALGMNPAQEAEAEPTEEAVLKSAEANELAEKMAALQWIPRLLARAGGKMPAGGALQRLLWRLSGKAAKSPVGTAAAAGAGAGGLGGLALGSLLGGKD